jgi:general secretion pathway protein K
MMPARVVRASERGAALFAVLGMIALLSGLAAIGLSRLRAATDTAREAALQSDAQMAAATASRLAASLILTVKASAGRSTAAIERPIRMDLDGKTVEIRFRDAGACINLNSVGEGTGQALTRLLTAAGVPPVEASRVVEATAERIARPGLLLADPQEWRAIAGISAESFARVAPALCTLPSREASSFNVNALAGPEAALLLIALGVKPDAAQRAVASRPAEGWSSTSDFWSKTTGEGEPDAEASRLAGTASRWYEVQVRVEAEDRVIQRWLLLDATASPARVAEARWLPSVAREEPTA